MLGMKKYRDIFVAKGSNLWESLEIKDDKERSVASKKIYDAINDNYNKLYSAEDREWFRKMHNGELNA